jgi:hypothetical protein
MQGQQKEQVDVRIQKTKCVNDFLQVKNFSVEHGVVSKYTPTNKNLEQKEKSVGKKNRMFAVLFCFADTTT